MSCTTFALDVRTEVVRQVVTNDQGASWNVDSLIDNVSCNQAVHLTELETGEYNYFSDGIFFFKYSIAYRCNAFLFHLAKHWVSFEDL